MTMRRSMAVAVVVTWAGGVARARARAVAVAVAAAGVLALVAGFGVPVAAADTGTPWTKLVTVTDPRISESSGLVASPTHPDLVWTVNDSGHTASVFGVSLRTGRTVVVLRLRDTDARDWESMAAGRLPDGRGVLWVGDTGDNNAVRESIVLRLVHEPARLPDDGRAVEVTPVSLRVRYPDGPHDVEALVATPDGRLLLVTKELFAGTVYQVPPEAVRTALSGTSVTTPVTARNVGGVGQSLVTDGAALPDGRIVLRGYVDAVVYTDRTRSDRGLAPQRTISLPVQQQGETLTVLDQGATLLVGSEGVRQPLWRVPLGDAASDGAAQSGTSGGATQGGATPAAGQGAGVASRSASGSGDPAGDPATGQPDPHGETLAWVLRVLALALLPVALLLGRRRR